MARRFAARGCTVTGADVDARMLAAGRSLAVADGMQVAWWECPAEDTGLPSASFDVVTAAQYWHWFDGDAAAREGRGHISVIWGTEGPEFKYQQSDR